MSPQAHESAEARILRGVRDKRPSRRAPVSSGRPSGGTGPPRIRTDMSQATPTNPTVWLLLVCLALPGAALLAGCGHSHHDDEGDIVVDNQTTTTTNEILHDFFIARFGQPFSADLLGGDLGPRRSPPPRHLRRGLLRRRRQPRGRPDGRVVRRLHRRRGHDRLRSALSPARLSPRASLTRRG